MTAKRRFNSIWILTDGKIGDLVQCRGIARHLACENVTEREVHTSGIWSWPLPFMPVAPQDMPHRPGSPLAPPFPELVLASGRRTVPYLRMVRRKSPRTAIVFLKDPGWGGRGVADFIWAPVHDALPLDDSVSLSTHTSPHWLDEAALQKAAKRAEERFGAIRARSKGPVTGLILGGNSISVTWKPDMAQDLADKLKAVLPPDHALLVTPSRRTPPVLLQALNQTLPVSSTVWYDDTSENAYSHILAFADRLIVTGDSHNMVSEALSTGLPVYVYRPRGLQVKFGRFLDAMETMGAIRDFNGTLPPFDGMKIDATAEIARRLEERLL